jgi:hypothetical protein
MKEDLAQAGLERKGCLLPETLAVRLLAVQRSSGPSIQLKKEDENHEN